MDRRRWFAVWAVVVCAVAVGGPGQAELPKKWARPRPLRGVPDYPYRTVTAANPPPTATVVSLARVPVLPPGPDPLDEVGLIRPDLAASSRLVLPDGTRVEVLPPPAGLAAGRPRERPPVAFQMPVSRVQVHHCYLSRVAITLNPDGHYQIGFRADQNPQPDSGDLRSPLLPGERVETGLQTAHLRRNAFVLKARGYGNYPVAEELPAVGLGKPVLVELPVESFWVQRGEPYSGYFEGVSETVRRHFDRIERMEIEFTYR